MRAAIICPMTLLYHSNRFMRHFIPVPLLDHTSYRREVSRLSARCGTVMLNCKVNTKDNPVDVHRMMLAARLVRADEIIMPDYT